jgi:hypothetical protein
MWAKGTEPSVGRSTRYVNRVVPGARASTSTRPLGGERRPPRSTVAPRRSKACAGGRPRELAGPRWDQEDGLAVRRRVALRG